MMPFTKNRIYFFALLTLFSFSASAIVDMRNANYADTWTDLQLAGSGYDLKVVRTYNSRSLYNGMFGFGWCSDFETKIDITAEGTLRLTECGAGQQVNYLPREFSKKEVDKTVVNILSALRAQKQLDAAAMARLKKDLTKNADLRAKYALELKISIKIREGSQFFANGKEVENIVFAKGYYTRNLVDGSAQRFSLDGHLTHLYDKNGNYLKFEYAKGEIKDIVDNNGRRLSFKYYNNKKVKTISGPNDLTAEYKYENMDNLAWAKNAWNNVYTYNYDDLHNLTKATWPDKTAVILTYDKKNDWVLSFTDREKCKEDYKYEDAPQDPKNHYWSYVKKTCGKEVVTESKYEFWHKTRADGQNYLWRVASVVNGNASEITYHETFGRPVSIRKNGQLYSYDYYPNGQVKTKTSKFVKLSYDYFKDNNKVSQVIAVSMNAKGKTLKTIKTSFKYDNKGNLTWAANSDGQKVEMAYDIRGRIAVIKDQSKKIVKIDYDEKSGKPAIVTRPGLGTISVTYKSNGEIDKVNSKEGPSIAMQVASTFNNLLEIISPATAEVYN